MSSVKVMREVAWLVFDEIHYMRDPGECDRLVYAHIIVPSLPSRTYIHAIFELPSDHLVRTSPRFTQLVRRLYVPPSDP